MVRPQFNLSAGRPQLLSPSASPPAGTNHRAAQVMAASWSQGCSPPTVGEEERGTFAVNH